MFSCLRVAVFGGSFLLGLSACNGTGPGKGRGPIVLGDPSTIVTEADSQYLQNMVPDPAFDAAPEARTATPARDTAVVRTDTPARLAQPATPTNAAAPAAGLTADFGTVQIILPGVEARGGNKMLKGASSAAFTLSGTSFGGTSVAVRGGTPKRIQQRTGYSAVVDAGGRTVLLSELGTQYSAWQTLTGRGGDYSLAKQNAPSFGASASAVRSAVQKAARRQRLSRTEEQKLLSGAKAVGSGPVRAVPRAFVWRIEGTGTDGKAYTKEVRLDVPL